MSNFDYFVCDKCKDTFVGKFRRNLGDHIYCEDCCREVILTDCFSDIRDLRKLYYKWGCEYKEKYNDSDLLEDVATSNDDEVREMFVFDYDNAEDEVIEYVEREGL